MPAKPPTVDAELVGVVVEFGTTNIAIGFNYPGTKMGDVLVITQDDARTLHAALGGLLAEPKDHPS